MCSSQGLVLKVVRPLSYAVISTFRTLPCDTLTPGNARAACPTLQGGFVSRRQGGLCPRRDRRPALCGEHDDRHACVRCGMPRQAPYVSRSWGARAPMPRSKAPQASQCRPAARRARGGHGRPSGASGAMVYDRQGHRRHASRVSQRFYAILWSRRVRDHTHGGVTCPAPLPRACTATRWSPPPPPQRS